jgi:hypothetical protein
MRDTRTYIGVLLSVALTCAALTLTGCGGDDAADESIGGEVATQVPPPASPDLSTPENAVRSYLDWTTFAYRMLNSDVVTATTDPWEYVRVDSYIELNRQQDRGLEQILDALEIVTVSEEETTTLVVTREDWSYRYFSVETLTYSTEWYQTSYEATYTVSQAEQGWVVTGVDATALGPVY